MDRIKEKTENKNFSTTKTIEKLIDSHRDTRAHYWTALLVTVSGTLTIMYSLDNNFKKIFFIFGFITSIVFLFLYFEKSIIINYLTRKLLEAENE